MIFRNAAATRHIRVSAASLAATLFLAASGAANAQQRPQPKAPAAVQPQPVPPSQPAQSPAAVEATPDLTFSQWTKLCDKNAQTKQRTMCRIGSDGRLDSGLPLVAAVVIEVESEPKRVLQVTVPVGVMLSRGTRVLVDDNENAAVVAPYLVCTNNGCVAQVEVDAVAIARMKNGKNLYIQAFSMQQSVMTLSLPLADFARAYDGPAADPKQVEEQNKKLIEVLQRKQQQAQPQANSPKR